MYKTKKSFAKNGFDADMSFILPSDEAHVVCAVFNDGSLKRRDMIEIFKFFRSQSFSQGKAYLSVEGLGNQPDFKLCDVVLYASYGVRMMSLSWNYDNILSGGALGSGRGLTLHGKNVLCEMAKCNVIADISHASERAAEEIAYVFPKPICASHSNSATVFEHKRNLSDNIIRKISKSGGVAGVTFCREFVNGKNSSIDDLFRHIEHIVKIGGAGCVGIGSDFDGCENKVDGLEYCGGIYTLIDKMLTKNYSETFINRLLFGNFSELFKKYE